MISIIDLKKNYQKKPALKGISLEIPRGSCYGLVGPNGSGKSTFIKILASVIPDYEGKVQFLNGDIHHVKKEIGYVPQEIVLEQNVTALDNLYFFGKVYGLKGKESKKRAKEVLNEIGLEKRAHDKVSTFSGGMKRRLNIGCALMHDPNLIIMDEPTVGIDPQSRRHIFQLIKELKQNKRTVIYASNYMEEVEQLCDVIALIDQGLIIENGDIDFLLQKYAKPSVFVKGTNCLPEKIEGKVEVHKEGYYLKTNFPLVTIKQVLNHCQVMNGHLERLELVNPRLEDVFFSLSGTQLRD